MNTVRLSGIFLSSVIYFQAHCYHSMTLAVVAVFELSSYSDNQTLISRLPGQLNFRMISLANSKGKLPPHLRGKWKWEFGMKCRQVYVRLIL